MCLNAFNSLENFSLSLENYNNDLEHSPQSGPLLCGLVEVVILDLKASFSLEILIPDKNLENFNLWVL